MHLVSGQIIDNFFSAKVYLDVWQQGDIQDEDIVHFVSFGECQLYAHKTSDMWILFVSIADLPPKICYKKWFIISAIVTPGLRKLKLINSFLFIFFYYQAAIRHDGLAVCSTKGKQTFLDFLWLIFGEEDGPGSIQLYNFVLHNGAQGCWWYCNVIDYHKLNSLIYYPALLWHLNYNIKGYNYNNIAAKSVRMLINEAYRADVFELCISKTVTEYKVMSLSQFLFSYTLTRTVTSRTNIRKPNL